MPSLNIFSWIIGLGASFGLLWVLVTCPRAQRLHWLLTGLLALFGALAGSRLGYVLEHPYYFSTQPTQRIQFWLGGLTWEGALAGGLLAVLVAACLWRWPLTLMMDHLSRLILPISVASWVGVWVTGLGYGVSLPLQAWWGLPIQDETGLVALRNPVQPLAILSLVAFFGLLELILQRKDTPGLRGSASILILGADMLLFSFLRADSTMPLWGLRVETWCAIFFTILGILITIHVLHIKIKKSPKRSPFQPMDRKKNNEIESDSGAN